MGSIVSFKLSALRFPWTETGYRFVKRQSQSDPNVWVALSDGRPAASTASARDH
jgi:Bacterial transglutaminase-like cysteine proteinase BTLCP